MNSLPDEGFEYTPLTSKNDESEDYEVDLNIDNRNGFWKYDEDVILKEVRRILERHLQSTLC